jgi:hypothetical protein
MRVGTLPGTTNVLRFPVERRARPILELLRMIKPDIRELLAMAETFDLAVPGTELRDHVDAETARYILEQYADGGATLKGALEALLEPVVAAAIGACRAANDLAVDAADAQEELLRTDTNGHFRSEPLRGRVGVLMLKSTELLIEAYTRSEEAEGVARAVQLAGRGVPWTPRNFRAGEEALLAFGPG